MTRFARAKGSKSSNEKSPEDSTPWEVMKEQLLQAKKESEDAKNREEAEKQRIENYENFLKEHKVQKRKATWCDFPEDDTSRKQNISITNGEQSKKNKKKNKQSNNEIETKQLEVVSEATADININKTQKKKAKKNKKVSLAESETPQSNEQNLSGKAPNIKQSNNKMVSHSHLESEMQENEINISTEIAENIPNGKKKKNKKGKQTSSPDDGKLDQKDNNMKSFQTKNNNTFDGKQNNQKNMKQKRDKKFVDGQPVRRKVVDDNSFQFIINGKEVELVRFDGFPIMKRDAERLQELKDSMIKKGIPKSEVQRTMKLERRRAEKALARVRREVCYNCRKGGHNLSDCPDLKSKIPGADLAEGVCFKCGSTEHRQFECKVQRDKEFRFATCFICKEPGHIARQCPDNPKGLYPNGGSCKLCGDVTHMRKDCPTANDKKEGTSIKLQTLDTSENIEDIGQQSKNIITEGGTKKPKKIKF